MAIAGFNANYYVQTYPDVLVAISQGIYKSAEEHFVKNGAKEGRNPNANFDSKYYLASNQDVLQAVASGAVASAYDHYIAYGYKEGRIPSAALASFNGQAYLDANADVKTAGYTATTALGHYVLYGAAENRTGGGNTQQQVTGNYVGTTADDTVTPAGGQASTVRVEGGQQGAKGDTLVVTSGSAASFQFMDLSNNADQNQTRDNSTGNNTGNKIGPVVQGFENIDATAATINMNLTALDRTSITNTGSANPTQTGSVILGGTGRDTLTGNTGNDSLVGNDGNDNITGGAGADSIYGGVGNDTVDGGTGNDLIEDGAGDDVVTGGAGNDTINVGAGTNSIDGGADNDTITLTADQGTATVSSTVLGGDGNDIIVLNNTVITAASRVSVSGGAGNDTITAGLGVETINGGTGNDTVKITTANRGANDLFRGNEGQDIIQLEIPTGSGTNTFEFESAGTTAATSQFAGFEAIALIDSSGNNNLAKQYKIILTDTFVAQNFQTGSFLIDARGLPGGSNLVIDFSKLTSASAALFTQSAFRVLTSPSTDVRDQNNVTITAAYSVQTGNSVLNNVTAFTVYAGETTITAGTEAAYTTDRLVNTGTGQGAYTTVGGAAETASSGGLAGQTFTLTVGNDTFAATATGTNDTFNGSVLTMGGNDVLVGNGGTDVINLINQVGAVGSTTANIVDIDTINISTAADITLTGTLFSAVGEVVLTGAGATNVAALSADAQANTIFTLGSGYGKVITDATNAIAKFGAAGSATGSGISTTKATGVSLAVSAASTVSSVTTGAGIFSITGSGNLTLGTVTTATSVNGSAMTGALTYTETGIAVTSGSGSDVITLGAATTANVNTGAGNDTATAVAGTGLTTADTVAFGAGTDTLALTGSTAVAATDLNGVSGLEVLTVQNTTTYVAITTVEALVDAGATLTLAATSLTTGTLTFNGVAENNGFFNITGGGANDSIAGGLNADTLSGGAGADTLVGNGGADVLSGGAGIDVFQINATASVLANMDTITDYRAAGGANAGAADTIDLTAQVAAASSVNTTVLNLAAQVSLQAALDFAANANNATANGLSVFIWGGNTYAYVETMAAGTTYVATDTVIQITGTPFTAGTAIAGLGIDGV